MDELFASDKLAAALEEQVQDLKGLRGEGLFGAINPQFTGRQVKFALAETHPLRASRGSCHTITTGMASILAPRSCDLSKNDIGQVIEKVGTFWAVTKRSPKCLCPAIARVE